MAQTTVTVRLDAETKAAFVAVCEELGMNANTAINLLIHAVNRNRCIPFPISVVLRIIQIGKDKAWCSRLSWWGLQERRFIEFGVNTMCLYPITNNSGG